MKADLVLVEWHDAHSDSSWATQAEATASHAPAVAHTVGWVFKRDPVGISLFASVVDGEMFGERLFILAEMVKKVTVLKKAKR